MRRPFLRAGGAVLAVALTLLGLAACGSSGSTTAASSSATSSSATSSGSQGVPIKIGTICSCSGPLAASLGSSITVLQSWVQWTNANGGINGHPVQLFAYDDGQNPTTALADAKRLVEQDKVVAIVGTMSLVSANWAKYVDSAGIPVVGGQPVDTTFFTDPNFYASGTTLPMLLQGEVALAKASGAKTIGVAYCAETPVCAQLPPIITALATPMGMKVSTQEVSSTAANYIAPCLALKKAGATALFTAVNSDVVPRVVDSCAQQGYKPINIASSATTQKSWTTDPNLNGSVFAATNAVYTDTSVPGVKDFMDALQKYAPSVPSSPEFSYPLLYPWAGGQLFAAAAKAANLTPASTSADLIRGLHSLTNETLDGIAPPLNFPQGSPGFPNCYFTGSITGGSFVANNSDKPVCIPEAQAQALLQGILKASGG